MKKQIDTLEIRSVFYASTDDIRLHVRDYQPLQPSNALPIICLPGLSRNARDFDRLARILATHETGKRRVVAFDYRGRGLSENDPNWENYNILKEADDVVTGLAVLGIEHGIFIGTSRGGLITMLLAATRPTAIKGVVLNDIGPAIDGSGLMQIKAYLTHPPKPKNWSEAIESQKALMGKSFPAFDDDDWAHEAECRYQNVDGQIKADYDPNLANTMKSLDAGSRLPTAWSQFCGLGNVPMLVIRGENSNILSQKTLQQMNELHERMETLQIEGQGHAPALHTGAIPEKIARFAVNVDLSNS